MVENGVLRLGTAIGVESIGLYRLDEMDEAMTTAAAAPEWGRQVVLSPWG